MLMDQSHQTTSRWQILDWYVNLLDYNQTKLLDSTRTQSLFWTNLMVQEMEFLIDNGSQTDEEESDTVEG